MSHPTSKLDFSSTTAFCTSFASALAESNISRTRYEKFRAVAQALHGVPSGVIHAVRDLNLSAPDDVAFVFALLESNYPKIVARHVRMAENLGQLFDRIATEEAVISADAEANDAGKDAVKEFFVALTQKGNPESDAHLTALLKSELGVVGWVNAVNECIKGPSSDKALVLSGENGGDTASSKGNAPSTQAQTDPLEEIFCGAKRKLEPLPDNITSNADERSRPKQKRRRGEKSTTKTVQGASPFLAGVCHQIDEVTTNLGAGIRITSPQENKARPPQRKRGANSHG